VTCSGNHPYSHLRAGVRGVQVLNEPYSSCGLPLLRPLWRYLPGSLRLNRNAIAYKATDQVLNRGVRIDVCLMAGTDTMGQRASLCAVTLLCLYDLGQIFSWLLSIVFIVYSYTTKSANPPGHYTLIVSHCLHMRWQFISACFRSLKTRWDPNIFHSITQLIQRMTLHP